MWNEIKWSLSTGHNMRTSPNFFPVQISYVQGYRESTTSAGKCRCSENPVSLFNLKYTLPIWFPLVTNLLTSILKVVNQQELKLQVFRNYLNIHFWLTSVNSKNKQMGFSVIPLRYSQEGTVISPMVWNKLICTENILAVLRKRK